MNNNIPTLKDKMTRMRNKIRCNMQFIHWVAIILGIIFCAIITARISKLKEKFKKEH